MVSPHTRSYTLNGDGLRPVRGGRERLLGRVEGRVEKSVDERRLAKPRLA